MRYWRPLVALLMLFAMMTAINTVINVPGKLAHATSGDWSTFLAGNARSGYNEAETAIDPTNAQNLKKDWTYSTGGEISAEPVVANGQIYLGSWDGNEYATDLNGRKIWSAPIGGQTPNCSHSQTFGVASTSTVANVLINGTSTPVVFVGGRDTNTKVASLYALNVATGGVIWETQLSSSSGSFSWSSPALYNGSVYMGLASYDDCPLVRGALVQLDATTGAIQHTFYVVPGDCLGGSIWSSPTIDEANGTVYVTTGNNGPCSTTEIYAQAIIKLNASDLSFIDSWQVPTSQHGVDSDFGATPTLFTATYGGSTHQMVGAVNKNGIYYAFDRSSLSAGPIWTAKISTSTISISSSAWDGTTLYVAGRTTSIGGVSCKGSIRALDPASGHFIWQDCLNSGGVLAPVSAIPGVVFVGEGVYFLAINASTGNILFKFNTGSNINDGASISNGVVYIGNNTGTLYAFGLPSMPTPTTTITPSPSASVTTTASPSPTLTVSPSVTPVTPLAQDTFQRSDQSLWGTATDDQRWGADANTLSNFSITQDTGQVVGSGTSATGYNAVLGPSTTNVEVQFNGSISSFGGNTLGAVLHWTDRNDFYKAYITGTNLVIQKKVKGTITNLKSTSFTAMPGTSYTVLFSIVGTTLSASVWPTGTTPPGSWMVTATDSSLSSGSCGLLAYLQSGVKATITSFLATSQ